MKHWRLATLAPVLVLAFSTSVLADESSGRWTGAVELQGNYYWETSTRVIAPSIRGRVTSPDGTDVRAEYLVDAITSASQAAGLVDDIRFTETRHQGTVGVGREFDLGEAQLRLDATGRVSWEPDYLGTALNFAGTLSLAQRCTLLGLSLTYIHDDVGAVVRGRPPATDGPDLSNRGRVGQLEGMIAGASISQVLTPTVVLSGGYDLLHNYGFLQNAYRRVQIEGAVPPEVHPERRTRHSLHGRVAWFIPESRTAIHGLYRFYVDDWDIAAITPEARIYQEIGDGITLRLRYRYYQQTRSFFWTPNQYTTTDLYVSADPKMSAFESHLVGVHARLTLEFLERSWLAFLSRGEFWVSFEYWFQTSRFGNGAIAQTAFAVPF